MTDKTPNKILTNSTRLQPLTQVPWVAVTVFVVIACGLAWLVALPLWLSGEGLSSPLFPVIAVAMMFTPLLAALVVVFFVQKPRPGSIPEYLGLWPLRPAKRTIWLVVVGLFGSILLVVATVFLAAALGLVTLDLVNFSGFAAAVAAATGSTIAAPAAVLVVIQLLTIPFGAVINSFVTIGEEVGWRGWLLPSLLPLGKWPALLISGAIWGFWHSPLILLGYNFAQPNWFGVALMIVATMFLGTLFGWLRLRTASVWPSVVAHGAFNAAGGFIFLVIAAGAPVDLVSAGPLGWVSWIVMSVVIVALILTGQFRKQPTLQRKTQPST